MLSEKPKSSSASKDGNSTVRFGPIDGMRAVAAVAVTLGHYWGTLYATGLTPPSWMDFFGRFGHFAVTLFLVLSGFCVSWPYVGPANRKFVFKEFLRRRVERLYPMYLIGMTVAIGFNWYTGKLPNPWDVVAHLTFTHNWFPDFVHSWGPFWTMALEFQLYVVFGLAMIAPKSLRLRHYLILGIALWIFWRGALPMMISFDEDNTFTLLFSVPGRILDFAAGVFIAKRVGVVGSRLIPGRYLIPAGIACAICLTAALKLPKLSFTGDLLQIAGVTMLLALAVSANNALSQLLGSKPLVSLGEATYSIYVVHQSILKALVPALAALLPWPDYVAAAPTVPICLAMGLILFRIAERPAIMFFARRRNFPNRLPIPTPSDAVAPPNDA